MPYSVYVISLNRGVWDRRKFRRANPGKTMLAKAFYVGSTAKDPELRFEQHKRGYKACGLVRDFGEQLAPDLYEKYNPIPSRRDAEELESYLAEVLRGKGYGVWTN